MTKPISTKSKKLLSAPAVKPKYFTYLNFFLVAVLSIAAAAFAKLYLDSQKKISQIQVAHSNLLTTPSPEDIKQVVAAVEKHLLLPSETPKLITISDAESLKKDQPFFTNAKDGDRLLIYSQKVILYSPGMDKIVDVAFIRISPGANAAAMPTEIASKYKIIILNGSNITGLTKKIDTILGPLTLYEVVDRENAQKKDYKKTIVADLKGNKAAGDKLAETISATVASLPNDENKPADSIDFVVIVGEDKK